MIYKAICYKTNGLIFFSDSNCFFLVPTLEHGNQAMAFFKRKTVNIICHRISFKPKLNTVQAFCWGGKIAFCDFLPC
jgi:hypothetical protein